MEVAIASTRVHSTPTRIGLDSKGMKRRTCDHGSGYCIHSSPLYSHEDWTRFEGNEEKDLRPW
eukprot:scaffold2364_cov197-Pavlova_lutheri.AAC.1